MGVIQMRSSQRTAALGLLNGGLLGTRDHGLRLGLGLTEVMGVIQLSERETMGYDLG